MQQLALSHKSFIEEKLAKLSIPLSEYNFANLYLFRDIHRYELLIDDLSFIKGITYDNCPVLLPLDPIDVDVERYIPYMKAHNSALFPLSDVQAFHFLTASFKSVKLDQDSDYIFTRTKLSLLPGRNLSSRRNLVSQFLDGYESEVLPLKEHADMALEVLQKKGGEDARACREAIELSDVLGLEGIIIRGDLEPVAFGIGSPLTKDHYLFHFSKALPDIKGASQYLYQAMAQNIDHQYILINLEQDLGVQGIRQAKRSYYPDHMGCKWRITLSI